MVFDLAKKIRIMNFGEISKIVREALALEESVEISPDSKLVDLGAEPIYVLDIFYKLEIPYMRYCSGERISDKGKRRLAEISNLDSRRQSDYKTHWQELSRTETTHGFINQLLVRDLLVIQSYEATH